MIIEQIYTGCLSQGSYYIESQGEAAIIDPLRETAPYIEKAIKNNSQIKYVFETHFHADFVSGHISLAKETGATIVYGPKAETGFDALIAKDQQEFKIGDITLTVIHTPGHTIESTTYLLRNSSNKDIAIFSGDTLFLGDVGSIPLGLVIGWLLLTLAVNGYWLQAIILPFYYFVDATLTLLQRLGRGEKFWEAHKQHYYQQAVQKGMSHSRVAASILLGNTILVVLAVTSIHAPVTGVIGAISVVLVMLLYFKTPLNR